MAKDQTLIVEAELEALFEKSPDIAPQEIAENELETAKKEVENARIIVKHTRSKERLIHARMYLAKCIRKKNTIVAYMHKKAEA